MMQQLFLQKINSFLLGRVLIKKVYFHTGSFFRKQQQKEKQAEPPAPPAEYTKCPVCGAQMRKGLDMCSVCEREQREELRSKLAELLRIQPWLKYEDCLAYYKCDKILFTAVKENLESLLAVMFLLEKQPEDITLALYENALTYLRRDQGVSAFGSRLHGKKQ